MPKFRFFSFFSHSVVLLIFAIFSFAVQASPNPVSFEQFIQQFDKDTQKLAISVWQSIRSNIQKESTAYSARATEAIPDSFLYVDI